MQGAASVDPYKLFRFLSVNYATSGISFSTQTVNTSVKNLVMIVAGQSNAAAVGPSAYSPTNGTKIDMLNIYDGAIYVASDPLLGCSYPRTLGVAVNGPGCMALRIADNLITAGKFDRVIILDCALGSTKVADWETGGLCGDTLPVAIRRIASLGITAGTNVTIVVLWMQGESDTDASTSRSAYSTSLSNVIATSRTEGFSGTWFVAKMSRSVGTTSANVTNAQADVVSHGSNIWAGPDLDALSGNNCSASACRQADDTHFSNAGMASAASAWQTALGLFGAPF